MSEHTKKLFADDPYLQACDATVVDIIDNTIVVLDKTIFYAFSGGQLGDTGTINKERVVDTKYKTDEKLVIYHYMQSPTKLKVGKTVHCQIDWDRRYHHMRVHSLVHIMMSIFEEMYGKQEVIGSSVADKGRGDVKFFDPIDIETIQTRTQQLIDEGHDISTVPDGDDLVKRIWKMPPLPDQYCGGTHPRNSKEIGNIRLKRKTLGAQGQRIYGMLEK